MKKCTQSSWPSFWRFFIHSFVNVLFSCCFPHSNILHFLLCWFTIKTDDTIFFFLWSSIAFSTSKTVCVLLIPEKKTNIKREAENWYRRMKMSVECQVQWKKKIVMEEVNVMEFAWKIYIDKRRFIGNWLLATRKQWAKLVQFIWMFYFHWAVVINARTEFNLWQIIYTLKLKNRPFWIRRNWVA